MTIKENVPFYIVFGGINGAGKSTLFHSGLWRCKDMSKSMARVNPDEILREGEGDWRSAKDQRAAGKTALERIDLLFREGKSFNQETTLTGRIALRNIEQAHRLGYRVFLYYVGVENEEIALERIVHRASLGGHSIDEQTVRRRFRSSLENFSRALDFCEQAIAFDNTREFTRLAIWKNATLAWWGNPKAHGPWLARAMQSETWRPES